LATYERLHSALAENIVIPDLVVYLRAETQTLMDRIAIRDRPYEREMSRQYIDELRQAYEEFFREYTQAPVLPLATDDLNIVHDPDDLAKVMQSIRTVLGEGTHQRALPRMEGAARPAEAEAARGVRRRLSDFQRWHEAEDRGGEIPTELYRSFIEMQGEMGALARELNQVWAKQISLVNVVGNQAEALGRAAQERRAALQDELAACLGHLLSLANHAGIDLEDAYVQRVRSEHTGSGSGD
jgi:NTP pyrophosphatase (non-canonical NTP hydrolase)